jgi:hypothetical protein
MVVSKNTITISAELPLVDEYFFASVKEGQAYIGQIKKSELDKKALEGTEVTIDLPNHEKQNRKFDDGGKDIDDPEIIDLLIVYTVAAEEWALADWQVTDIHDLIYIALLRSNTSMENSETGITFNIVFKHKTDYVETNTVDDLYNITHPYSGYMGEVHYLRDEYYADLIVFLPKVDFTGGVAWLLNNPNGNDYYGVSLSRVQQSSWTYTVVHEIGHNMGCHHHAEQNVQPGPGLFYYSSGWRDISMPPFETKFSTIMTYEGGNYFPDGVTHPRIPYFSSPDIIFEGVPLGTEYADNVQTLKRTKTPVANYRKPPPPPVYYTVTLPDVIGAAIEPYASSSSPVLSGENFSFIVTLDPEYNQSVITVKTNDTIIYPSHGIYGIYNITANQEVTIEGIEPNIGIGENYFDNIQMYSYSNSIFIKNIETLHTTFLPMVEIIDMMGRVIYTDAIKDAKTVITLHVADGIYNVRLLLGEKDRTKTISTKVLITN